jgi:hypothetical protein
MADHPDTDLEAIARKRRERDGITSLPQGFTLALHGIWGHVYYREQNRALEVYIERPGVAGYDFLTWPESFDRWVYPDEQDVPEMEKARIQDLYRRWLAEKGWRTDF